MENSTTKETKVMWGIVAVIVIVGLVLISTKSGKENPSEIASEGLSKTEVASTTVTSGMKSSTSTKTNLKTVVPTKPRGNVVRYTSAGFSPFILEVKRGESVEFINESDKAMVIRANDRNPESFYPGFSQESGPLGKGGKFYFAFTQTGAWSYYNLNGNKEEGVILVK